MTHSKLSHFRTVWFCDFEFQAEPGERPKPACLVAWELRSNKLIRQWLTEDVPNEPPFDVEPDSLFVAYYSSAELGCCLALGWPMPSRVLDLFVEFRALTNGRFVPGGAGLLSAMTYFDLNCLATAEKQEMRELAMRGGEYSTDERTALLDYCQTDVDALPKLLDRMIERIDLPRALLRGRYMRAVATMEHTGTPIDTDTLGRLREHWPKLPSGKLCLDDETFRQAAKRHPKLVGKWRELRHTLGQMRLSDLAVGSDGRNRCLLSPFRARSGRNQPSNSKFIFGPSAWLRSLIKPMGGRAVAYVDWSQQEFGIAAALSKDANMQAAYRSGDPYLAFAKQAGAVPESGTKQTHKKERALFKACVLGVQYGMGEESLAANIGDTLDVARELLRLHRRTYPKFWQWSVAAVDHAMLYQHLFTTFGWPLHVGNDVNPRSLVNFPCQANGAEMLRLACCLMAERGVGLCAPVHDAVLVEGPADQMDETVASVQAAMRESSSIILDGFELETDFEIVSYPNRYSDERGVEMWSAVLAILAELDEHKTIMFPISTQVGLGCDPSRFGSL